MRWDLMLRGFFLIVLGSSYVLAAEGNRLTYLDVRDPYYVSRTFPKLTTPQWVGEEGVEAVVVLGIDDMRGHEKWEAYLRPILERLKQIDGRAPVSIMTCTVEPDEPHLQKWLAEGVSIETHTIDHPCPLLHGGDFTKAKSTFDRCVDLLNSIPGNRPVAFRVPCFARRQTQMLCNVQVTQGNPDFSVKNLTHAGQCRLPNPRLGRTNEHASYERRSSRICGLHRGSLKCRLRGLLVSRRFSFHLSPRSPSKYRMWSSALPCSPIATNIFRIVSSLIGSLGPAASFTISS